MVPRANMYVLDAGGQLRVFTLPEHVFKRGKWHRSGSALAAMGEQT